MTPLLYGNPNCNILYKLGGISYVGISTTIPLLQLGAGNYHGYMAGMHISQSLNRRETFSFPRKESNSLISKKVNFITPRSGSSSDSSSNENDSSDQGKTPFGYNRKDVLLIGLGVTVLGIGLKSGLEFAGVDPLQAGNVVQLVLVLGLTVGWISTYIFRVSNKEMTYAQQLRDYEDKVMQKRIEGLTEAELEALLEQVEEEKRRLGSGDKIN